MTIVLKIYLIGFIVALSMCVMYMKDNRHINVGDFLVSVLLALLSWITVLALWVGMNIKHGHDR